MVLDDEYGEFEMNFISSEKFFNKLNQLSSFEDDVMIDYFYDFDLVAAEIANLGDDFSISHLIEILGSTLPITESEFEQKFDKMIKLHNDEFMDAATWQGYWDYWVSSVIEEWVERIVEQVRASEQETV